MSTRPRPSRATVPGAFALVLSGCILGFPPFGPNPIDFQERTVVVENATDANWIITATGDFPAAYAIPAGATGPLLAIAPSDADLQLLDEDCNVVAALPWGETIGAVRIAGTGTLSSIDTVPATTTSGFSEYFQCSLPGFGRPTAGDPLPGGRGVILLSGDDLRTYRLDVADARLEPVSDAAINEFESEYVLSPDGEQVALSRVSGDTFGSSIHLAGPDGSDEELLVADAASPAWSPDGTQIAYMKLDPFASPGTISVIDLGSRESVDVAEGGSVFSWSPDGTRLAFMWSEGFAGDLEPQGELRVVNADGSGLLTIGTASFFASAPAWSPDGRQIAYVAPVDGGGMESPEASIAVHDFDADRTTQVADIGGSMLGEPAWSPDGSRIAFTIGPTGIFDTSGALGLVQASGGDIEQLAVLAGASYSRPIWSPDSEWLAAPRLEGMDFQSVLVAVPVDGGDEVTLAEGVAAVSAWLVP